jgi:hypothetical protein
MRKSAASHLSLHLLARVFLLAVSALTSVILTARILSLLARKQYEQDARRTRSMAPHELMTLVSSLPVRYWSYRFQPSEKHIGPYAQDFHNTFGVGTPRKIAVWNAIGVLFAAVQALHARMEELTNQVQQLEERISTFRSN